MTPIPDEIWHQIFSYFESVLPEDQWWMYGTQVDHCLRKTLMSIPLVSRQFRRVAQPLLYRTALIEGGHYDNEWHQGNLIRTLAAFPDLGLHSRTLSLKEYRLISNPAFYAVLQELLPSLDLPTAMRRHMEIKLEESLCRSDDWRSIDLATFLLALMPRVRLVDFSYHGSRSLIWMMSGRADMNEQLVRNPDDEDSDNEGESFGQEPHKDTILNSDGPDMTRASFANYGLPHVEELRLRTGDCRHDSTPIHAIEAVLLHPNLKTLRLLGSNWLQRSLDLLRWPNEPCGVQFLELRESLVEASSLRHILTRFRGLRTLLVHLADCARYDDDETEWEMNLDEIGSLLRELGQGLVELSLHTNNYEGHGDGLSQLEGHLGSLREMRSLKHLSVVYNDLIDADAELTDLPAIADVLPCSLETLHFHGDEKPRGGQSYRRRCGYVNDAVRKLLEHGNMPNLRQVSIERYYNESLEGEFDGPVAGWDMSVENKHLWMTYSGSGCGRTIVTFKRRD